MEMTPDNQLLSACGEFNNLNKTWIEANPEGHTPIGVRLETREYRLLAVRRNEILRGLVGMAPSTTRGLRAKLEIFHLLQSLEEKDSPRLCCFAIALLEDYEKFPLSESHDVMAGAQRILAGGRPKMPVEEKKPRRFNFHTIFAIFHN
jgi:hypothetical protein